MGETPTGRRQGDRKVDTFVHSKSGVTADIMLRGTRFYAVLLERQFEAPDANILKADLTDYAEHSITLEWFPIIEVEIDDHSRGYFRHDPDGEGVQLKTERFYLSISPAGRSYRVGWEVDEEHRLAEMEGYSISRRGHNEHGNKLLVIGLPLRAPLKLEKDNSYLLDYTEEVWRKLEEISDGIRMMRTRLGELVSTKRGVQQLLGAPPPAPALITIQDVTPPPIRTRTRSMS